MKFKLIFTFLFFSLMSIAQKGELNGQLVLDVPEDYKNVANKTKVFIEIDKKIDSTFVNDSLQFSFKNLDFGKANISFEPNSIPDRIYIIEIKRKNVKKIAKLSYSLTCKYDKSKEIKTCPICNKEDHVLPIYYGLIMDKPIFFKDKKDLRQKKRERKKQRKSLFEAVVSLQIATQIGIVKGMI